MEKHNIQLNYHSHAIDNKIIHNGCTLAQIWYRKPYQINLHFMLPFNEQIHLRIPLKGCVARERHVYTWILIKTKALQGGV
jgi:hypothetical protein